MTDVDLTEFTVLQAPKKKPCPVGDALRSLKPQDRRKLEAALEAEEQVAPGAIVQWLKARSFGSANPQFVSSHRKGTCKCPTST
jgi:hypothetical protein